MLQPCTTSTFSTLPVAGTRLTLDQIRGRKLDAGLCVLKVTVEPVNIIIFSLPTKYNIIEVITLLGSIYVFHIRKGQSKLSCWRHKRAVARNALPIVNVRMGH